ncbi:hypothetical protein SLEP1_g37293 [Rubroshorea leprosula]|uniref:Uncharacterized protein n=1 Tax=Rubroshorea leprosula TaxID=152421 RepID=A0AAV5KUQ3_9ROSI|nr:hypothetical protein SLEP1_g37293 [Rubroshorea leprosula]
MMTQFPPLSSPPKDRLCHDELHTPLTKCFVMLSFEV